MKESLLRKIMEKLRPQIKLPPEEKTESIELPEQSTKFYVDENIRYSLKTKARI